MDTNNELPQARKLPEGYEIVKQSGKKLNITQEDMPWLKEPAKIVPLVQIKLTDGTEFYIGTVTGHKTLIEEAENVGKLYGSQRDTNQDFYKQLRTFSRQDYNPDIPKLQNPRSTKSIFYVKSANGVRTYFMRFDDIEDKRVIIRIATCTKNGQAKVYKIIATQ